MNRAMNSTRDDTPDLPNTLCACTFIVPTLTDLKSAISLGVYYNKLATPNDELKQEELADYKSDDGETLKPKELGVIAQEVL